MSMSSKNPPPAIVAGQNLIYQRDGQRYLLRVGTSAWFAWLQIATIFRVRSPFGTFTMRREQAGNQRGDWYWRAYRKRDGKLHRVYVGKAGEVTLCKPKRGTWACDKMKDYASTIVYPTTYRKRAGGARSGSLVISRLHRPP